MTMMFKYGSDEDGWHDLDFDHLEKFYRGLMFIKKNSLDGSGHFMGGSDYFFNVQYVGDSQDIDLDGDLSDTEDEFREHFTVEHDYRVDKFLLYWPTKSLPTRTEPNDSFESLRNIFNIVRRETLKH